MKIETKKGMLVFSKQYSIVYFILSVDKEIIQEWYYDPETNDCEINSFEVDDLYSEYYDDFKIYHNGEKV